MAHSRQIPIWLGRAQAWGALTKVFKLAVEALRIRMAARFDPMLAVHTSTLEPLPHQIEAVYGELLGRTPLRFPAGRRSGRREDDHGGALHQGSGAARGRGTGADRRSGWPGGSKARAAGFVHEGL